MTEMKARLVDKDGNPLGTAANPLKISDHSISTATWGSITGTLADQTDLNMAFGGKVPTTRTVNSKALSADISLTPADVGSASSTTAALSILVYDGTPSAGDLSTYDEIYTTPALCFAALPAIINHAVTITMRKAGGSAYAAATLQRVVAGGSITIQGEYYYNNTVASAGSGAGKFNVIAEHSGLIQAGDRILLIQYSGTVGSSTPSDAFIDTVASVDGTEITLTTRTSDTFTTSWRYIICRTNCANLSINLTNKVAIQGLWITSNAPVTINGCMDPVIRSLIVETTGYSGLFMINSRTRTGACEYIGVSQVYASSPYAIYMSTKTSTILQNFYVAGTGVTGGVSGLVVGLDGSYFTCSYGYIRAASTANGVCSARNSQIAASNLNIDGLSSESKMANAEIASNDSSIINSAITFGSNITTQKSPANWAATTDGSYIS